MIALLALAALAADPVPTTPFTLSFTVDGVTTGVHASAATDLRLQVRLTGPLALDLGGRSTRIGGLHASGLAVGLRATSPWGAYARVGFAHHHETPAEVVNEHPFRVGLGTDDATQHRSGVEAALGWDAPLRWGEARRWGLVVEASGTRFLDPDGARWYAFLGGGLSFDVGRRRPPA